MADATLTSRRGILKMIPAVTVAASAGVFPCFAGATGPDSAQIAKSLLSSIETPAGASRLAVTIRASGAIEASCMSRDGALLHRNPATGTWI